jgi:uncharacterized delta-60 repeat protein
MTEVITIILILSAIAFSQTERWVYRYNGHGNLRDVANSIVYGADGNIYAAGQSFGSGTNYDFTVISLDTAGTERWVYRYNGPGNDQDEARSIVYGADGNIYAAGYSGHDIAFTVISLTSNGDQRWVYRYDGPSALGNDQAYSLVYGLDGNLYAAGYSEGISGIPRQDFMVISLSSIGVERWVYRYNGPANNRDEAYSVAYGADDNVYAAGTSFDSAYDFTVISVDTAGSQRWVYRYNGPGNGWDYAYSLVYGADENIYAAGWSEGIGTYTDFTVIGLYSSGLRHWVYRYDGPGDYDDWANSLIYGADGGLYAAGRSYGSNEDFAVIGLSSTGFQRWVHNYNGPGNDFDEAYTLTYGADGNIYIAGSSAGIGTNADFTVISLNPGTGIEEEKTADRKPLTAFNLTISTFQNQNLNYSLLVSEPATVTLSLYNLQGQKVHSWQNSASQGIYHYVKNLLNLSIGVYVIRAEVLGKGYKENKKFIVVR